MIAFLAIGSSVASATPVNWENGLAITPPTDAGPNPVVTVAAVSCASAGDCSAVGSYSDANGNAHGLLAAETNGQWEQAVEPTNLAYGAAAQPQIGLTGISCTSPGNCSAIGHYIDVNGLTQGFYVTETAGQWGNMHEVSHPSGVPVTTNPRINLTSISCPSAGNCSVVGTYLDSDGKTQGLIEDEVSGVWTFSPQEATLPSNAGAEPEISLPSVACGATGVCEAVGSYINTSGDEEGLLLPETGGNWAAGIAATLPSNVAAQPEATIQAVSCASSGNCSAVGSYVSLSGHTEGVLFTQTGGTWGTGVEAVLPTGANANPTVALTAVSCSSAGDCAAIGTYFDSAENVQGVLLDETNGSWGQGVKASLPAGAGSMVFVSMLAVSCYADGDCAAIGNYTDSNFSTRPLLVSEAGGAWSPGVEGALPYPGSNEDAYSGAISCVAGEQCVSLFSYLDNQGNQLEAAVDGGPNAATTETFSLTSAPPASAEVNEPIAADDLAATVSGGAGETGSITYTVFGPEASAPTSCAYGGTSVATATVNGDGIYTPSTSTVFTPTAGGSYWWYASYSGDEGNAAADNPAEATCGSQMAETTVMTPAVSTSVPMTDVLGVAIDPGDIGALLSGVTSSAGGDITFTVFGPLAQAPTSCTSGGSDVGTVTADGSGAYAPAATFVPGAPGNYWWSANYAGDSNNAGATSPCGANMAETVVTSPVTTTTIPPLSTAPTLTTAPTMTTAPTVTSTTPTTTAPTSTPRATFSGVRQSGSDVVTEVACKGAARQTCSLSFSLTVTEKLSGRKLVAVEAVKRVTRIVTLGSAKLRLAAGKTRKLTIKLDRTGTALLKMRHPLRVLFKMLQGGRKSTKIILFRLPRKSTLRSRH